MTDKRIFLPNGMEAIQATYREFPLEEFNENPLIQALPSLVNKGIIVKKLMMKPMFNKEDLELDGTYRVHMVNRLFQLYQPLPIHIDVWNMIQTLILQGYMARNPLDKEFKQYLNETGKKIINRSFDINSKSNFRSTSGCGLFLGYSGIGKTTTINRVLSNFPQVIIHSEYKGVHFNQVQLVWLKIEAPVNSSLKALCLQFFMKIDDILGTNNYKKHISRNSSVDNMLPLISQVAHNIGLGLLIIDEVQNIKKRGADQLMNFFVYLINNGINLCLVGTPSAYDLLGKELRITRRLTGNAVIIYNNMKNDEEFNFLLKSIWKYQWVRKYTAYNKEFRDVFYYETQGISDLIIKLFVYTQQVAIQSGSEQLSIHLVKKVAEEKFKLIQPMLDAIRSGNPHRIAKYEDIQIINSKLEMKKVEVKKETQKKKGEAIIHSDNILKPKKKILKYGESDLRYLLQEGLKSEKRPYEVLKENHYIEKMNQWIR